MNAVEVKSYKDLITLDLPESRWCLLDAVSNFTLPIGVKDGHVAMLNFTNNVSIIGEEGLEKANILNNLLISCAVLYSKQSLKIFLFDDASSLTKQYLSDGQCLHPQMTIVKKDACKRVLSRITDLISDRRSCNGFYDVYLLAFNEIDNFWGDDKVQELVTQIMLTGPAVGVHCVISGQYFKDGLAEASDFCSEKVKRATAKKFQGCFDQDVKFDTMPGVMFYTDQSQGELYDTVLLLPRSNKKEQRNLLRLAVQESDVGDLRAQTKSMSVF